MGVDFKIDVCKISKILNQLRIVKMKNKKVQLKNYVSFAALTSVMLLASIQVDALAQTSKTTQSSTLNPSTVIRQQKEIKIFMADISSRPLSESAMLYPPDEWYLSKYDGGKTVDVLLREGWSLLQIIPINAKQYYWVFAR